MANSEVGRFPVRLEMDFGRCVRAILLVPIQRGIDRERLAGMREDMETDYIPKE